MCLVGGQDAPGTRVTSTGSNRLLDRSVVREQEDQAKRLLNIIINYCFEKSKEQKTLLINNFNLQPLLEKQPG